ncbi:MAG: hypothetical protein DRP18_02800, partial [Candidatus Aenigmatarchaeota archaeon]
TIYMYYGNSTALSKSNETSVLTYSTPQEIYYELNSLIDGETINVASYVDNNNVTIQTTSGESSQIVDNGSIGSFSNSNKGIIKTTGPISARALQYGEAIDTIAPISFAGTRFGYPVSRDSDVWEVYSPFGNANVTIYNYNSTPSLVGQQSFTINKGSFQTINYDVSKFGILESDIPILVEYRGGTADDAEVLINASKELIGISSSGYVGALEDNTYLTIYRSDGTSSSYTLNRGKYISTGGGGSQGTGAAIRIVADKPVVATAQADSDGSESVSFWNVDELNKEYIIPTTTQYIAVACYGSNINLTLYNPDGTVNTTTSCGSNNLPYPDKAYFGNSSTSASAVYPAGMRIKADGKIYVYYEYDNQDETNVLGIRQARKYYYPEPSIGIGNEEEGMELISTVSGDTPLYTNINPKNCGILTKDETCYLTWYVNATGELDYYWNVSVLAYSNNALIESNRTSKARINIKDTKSPYYTEFGDNSTGTVDANTSVKFYVYWFDNYNLSAWIFSWNATPSNEWINQTSGSLSDKEDWGNTTLQIPTFAAGKYIGYKFYANDSNSNQNVTSIGIIYVNYLPDSTPPVIESQWATPETIGYGQEIIIYANLTDNVGIDKTIVNITYPNGSTTVKELEWGYDSVWQTTFNNTWQWGNYSYWILCNDTSGNENSTEDNPGKFYVRTNASIFLKTEDDIYGANQNILLSLRNDWWNSSWKYRTPITVYEVSGNNLTDYQINLTIDTQNLISQGKMNSDCSDIRFVDNESNKLTYWIESGCGLTNSVIWIKINLTANKQKKIYMYYGNETPVISESNKNETLLLVGEAGILEVGSSPITVNLQANYVQPRIFAVPRLQSGIYRSGGVTTQHHLITNVQSGNFTIEQVESPTAGDNYINITNISYLVLKSGVYFIGLENPLLTEVGTTSSSGSYTTLNFQSSFSQTPALLADTQTNINSANQVYARGRSLTATSAQIQTEEDDSSSPSLTNTETIAYVAIEKGTDDINNIQVGDASTSDSFISRTFSLSYSTPPSVVAQLVSENGGDQVYAVTRAISTTGFEIALEEPASKDGGHITESFSWLSVPSGMIYGKKYLSQEPTVEINSEEEFTNVIPNVGSTNISGYLLMQVKRNSTNELLSTQINDTQTGMIRNINSDNFLDISSIWNSNPWNTDSQETGYYKMVVYLTDQNGNVLRNDNGTNITTNYIFYVDIVPPEWNNLGANNTNPKPNNYVKFHANWSDNGQLDIWKFYWNATGSWQESGEGTFTSNPDWSNITLQIPADAEAKTIGYYFKANDTEGSYNTTDTYTIDVQDITPPSISNEQAKPSIIHRNETVNITATITDNKDINETWVEIGIPNIGYANKSMTFLSGSIYNLTYKSIELGVYNFTAYANDSSGNLGNGSSYNWKVYGWSNITWTAPIDGSYPIGTIVNLTCKIRDVNTTQEIENYPVTFKHDGDEIGTNLTNTSGYATISWNTSDLEGGFHIVGCEIEDNSTLFYNTTVNSANTTIEILVPDINVTDFEHENQYEHSVNEYETGDTIQWVNVTVNNTGGAKAYSVNVSLNILDASNQVVDWFSTQTQNCNNLNVGQTCETQFSSATIPTTVNSGIYKWNITTIWSGGGTPPNHNTSITFIIHDLQDNFSSSLSHEKIVINQSAIYNFTIFNPWSSNL